MTSKNYSDANKAPSQKIETMTISTSHADVAIADIPGDGLPILTIHGNSLCKEAFIHQWHFLTGRRRVISIDLPGHGASSDAVDPQKTYCFSGYADCIMEVLSTLEIERLAVLGHSLGGHVALELMARHPTLAGVMIFGTPPIPPGPEGASLGFLPNPEMAYTGAVEISDDQVTSIVNMSLGPDATSDIFFTSAVRRADGRARQHMFEAALAGTQADERELVAASPIPLAIVNGASDPVINLDYIDSLEYRALWRQKPIRIAGAGHGMQWQDRDEFNPILEAFLADIE
ncbi:alpha/beta hydrolase [Rhizobium pusense]|uniref:alpha/beta fold hydrolase n=1 Tax=Agrobacterium pusense TaxID=648995 RepID=UPI00244D57FF|nr:alpha/beta hydrolase [Agrobacterium pusense]MDH1270496.1 alpha/beta hydrolase [Agrobacterium pusense]